MFESVPEGWSSAKLADVAKISMGETLLSKDLTGVGVPVFSANTDDGPWGYTDRNRKTLHRGTIIVGARGSIGFPRLPPFDAFTCTQTTISIEPDESIVDSAFLFNALQVADIKGLAAQQAIPMLTIGSLSPLLIPLPTLDEQRRIAEVLRAAVDALVSTSILSEAFDGILTRYRREILKPLIPDDPNHALRLGDICDLGRGFAFKSEDYVADGILNYRVTNVGRPVADLGEKRFLPARYLYEYSGQVLNGGEIVLVMVGATVGKLGRVPKDLCPALLNQNMWTLNPKSGVSPDLLWHLAHVLIEEKVHSAQGGAYSFLTKKDFLRHRIAEFDPSDFEPHICAMSSIESILFSLKNEEVMLGDIRRLIANDLLSGRVRVPA